MHPMSEDLSKLTESQIEQKLLRLNSIYFMTENDAVRQQMILLTDTYKLELEEPLPPVIIDEVYCDCLKPPPPKLE